MFVVDASVAAKWLLPAMQEPLVEQANRLLGQQTVGSADFVVPDLFWPEIGNVL